MSDYVLTGYWQTGYVTTDTGNLYVEDGYFVDGYVDNNVVIVVPPSISSNTWEWNRRSNKIIKKHEQDVIDYDEDEALLILLSM